MSREPVSLLEWKRRAEESAKLAQEKRARRPGRSLCWRDYVEAVAVILVVGTIFFAAAYTYLWLT